MAKDLRQSTIDVYNDNAQSMAERFRLIPPRVEDIDLAFKVAGNPKHARVFEIGCADGRDAKAIVTRAAWYLGIDPAADLIKIAKEHVPKAEFEVADAVTFKFPNTIDVVFGFASFIHLNKTEVATVFKKLNVTVRSGGAVYLSLKWAPEYHDESRQDRFGIRQYFFYNQDLIAELAPGFEIVEMRREVRADGNHADWIELVLKRL